VAVRGADREREGRLAALAFARRVRELGLGAEQALVLVREALLD